MEDIVTSSFPGFIFTWHSGVLASYTLETLRRLIRSCLYYVQVLKDQYCQVPSEVLSMEGSLGPSLSVVNQTGRWVFTFAGKVVRLVPA